MVGTFADSVTGLVFDGQTLRIEFGVTRFDDVKPNTPITGRRYPACRLVLPPVAAVDLINRMQQVAPALTQAGVVKAVSGPQHRRQRPADRHFQQLASRGSPACGRACHFAYPGVDPWKGNARPRQTLKSEGIKVSLCLYCRRGAALLKQT